MGDADRDPPVPRVAHTTGELDIHDIAVLGDGRIVFVNTLYSCLALLSPVYAFPGICETRPSSPSSRPRIAAI